MAIGTGAAWLLASTLATAIGEPAGRWLWGATTILAFSVAFGCTRNPVEEQREEDEVLIRSILDDDHGKRR
jgi:hypothetical protein